MVDKMLYINYNITMSDFEKYSESNKKLFLEEMEKLNNKIDRLQTTVDELNTKLNKHISFIDETYEGLKNPINAARKWLGR
tara:strand:- start:532 stop:774 length:243 start_codon:yes stop_codon:yes gene_type:complete